MNVVQWRIQPIHEFQSISQLYLYLEAKIERLQKENRIPKAAIKTMLELNQKRNILVHQYNATKLRDRSKFISDAQSVFVTLREQLQDRRSTTDKQQLASICGRRNQEQYTCRVVRTLLKQWISRISRSCRMVYCVGVSDGG